MGTHSPPAGSTRARILGFLHDSKVQGVLLALLVVDVVTVIFGSLVEVYYWESKFQDSQEVVKACLDGAGRRVAASSGDSVPCAERDHYGDHRLHDIELGLILVSIVILSIFVVEHLLHFWALQLEYLKSWDHPLDLFMVLVSLGLEMMAFAQVTGVGTAAGLIVPLARVWRFARIIHGAKEVVEEVEETQAEEAQAEEELEEAKGKSDVEAGGTPSPEI